MPFQHLPQSLIIAAGHCTFLRGFTRVRFSRFTIFRDVRPTSRGKCALPSFLAQRFSNCCTCVLPVYLRIDSEDYGSIVDYALEARNFNGYCPPTGNINVKWILPDPRLDASYYSSFISKDIRQYIVWQHARNEGRRQIATGREKHSGRSEINGLDTIAGRSRHSRMHNSDRIDLMIHALLFSLAVRNNTDTNESVPNNRCIRLR